MALLVHAVAGRPVDRSLSPVLALLTVARLEEAGVEGLRLDDTRAIRIDASTPAEALQQFDGLADAAPVGGLHAAVAQRLKAAPKQVERIPLRFLAGQGRWLSLTSPLKHQVGAWECTDGAQALRAVNALLLDEEGVRTAGTDGSGVLAVARLAGHPAEEGAILRLRGGGGAARSTAHAWIQAGGRVDVIEGRRRLEPWPDATSLADQDGPADLGIDFDGEGVDLGAKVHLDPVYQGASLKHHGSVNADVLDGRWMLVAQHLAAWRSLWAPELAAVLPSEVDLMEDLLAVEADLNAA